MQSGDISSTFAPSGNGRCYTIHLLSNQLMIYFDLENYQFLSDALDDDGEVYPEAFEDEEDYEAKADPLNEVDIQVKKVISS